MWKMFVNHPGSLRGKQVPSRNGRAPKLCAWHWTLGKPPRSCAWDWGQGGSGQIFEIIQPSKRMITKRGLRNQHKQQVILLQMASREYGDRAKLKPFNWCHSLTHVRNYFWVGKGRQREEGSLCSAAKISPKPNHLTKSSCYLLGSYPNFPEKRAAHKWQRQHFETSAHSHPVWVLGLTRLRFAGWPWASLMHSLSLGVLTCKMRGTCLDWFLRSLVTLIFYDFT